MEIIEWLNQNYGMIIVIVVVLILLFNKQIKKSLFKKKKEKEDVSFLEQTPDIQDSLAGLEETNLFNDMKKQDSLSLFKQQKTAAKKYIQQLQEEGKALVLQQNKDASEYQQKINQLNIEKKQLGIKYTTWVNKLNIVENMIVSQIKMEEELEKLKENNGGK